MKGPSDHGERAVAQAAASARPAPDANGAPSRFVVGIDLGTTNSALAYVDTAGLEAGRARRRSAPSSAAADVAGHGRGAPAAAVVPLPRRAERARQRALPPAVGRAAGRCGGGRPGGARAPPRCPSAWCRRPSRGCATRASIARRDPAVGPSRRGGDDAAESRALSPVEASWRTSSTSREAWDDALRRDDVTARLEQQEIVLTVPASFDAVGARAHRRGRARRRASSDVTLLEEPQAALYAWIDGARRRLAQGRSRSATWSWCATSAAARPTSPLIAAREEDGALALDARRRRRSHPARRRQHGPRARPRACAKRLARRGQASSTRWQMRALVARVPRRQGAPARRDAARRASPVVDPRPRHASSSAARCAPSSTRDEVERTLRRRLLPAGRRRRRARDGARRAGLSELGLPYAADAAVTRHLAAFLGRSRAVSRSRERRGADDAPDSTRPRCSSTAA